MLKSVKALSWWFAEVIRIHWILPRRYCPTPRHTGVSLRYFFALTDSHSSWSGWYRKCSFPTWDYLTCHSERIYAEVFLCFWILDQKGALRPSGQKLSHCFANKLCCSAVSQVWVAEQICNYLQNLAISFMPAIGYRYEISPHVCGLHVGVPVRRHSEHHRQRRPRKQGQSANPAAWWTWTRHSAWPGPCSRHILFQARIWEREDDKTWVKIV